MINSDSRKCQRHIMAPFTALCIQDLTGDDSRKLTQVLQIRPQEDAIEYGNRVPAQIAYLPLHLRKPKFLPNLVVSKHAPALLCQFHKNLNSRLIRSIFNAIVKEIGQRCNSLIAHSQSLTPQQRDGLLALRRTHSMWLDRDTFQKIFLEAPECEWPYQQDQCEACMLSRIGGRLDMLTTLRSLLLSRTRTRFATPAHRGPTPLLQFVDQWLTSYGHQASERIQQSNQDAAELKVLRKAIWKARRRPRRAATEIPNISSRAMGPSRVEEDSEDDEAEDEWSTQCDTLVSTSHLQFPIEIKEKDDQTTTESEREGQNVGELVDGTCQMRGSDIGNEVQWQTGNLRDDVVSIHLSEDTETRRKSEIQRASVQNYEAPRSNWSRLRNMLKGETLAQSPNDDEGALSSEAIYKHPAVSGSWNTVTSVHEDRAAIPASPSPYVQPRQIWETMREQTMNRPDVSSMYGSDRRLSQSSTISVPYPKPLNVRRSSTTGRTNESAETLVGDFQEPPSCGSAPAPVPGTKAAEPKPALEALSAPSHPINNDREYAEIVAAQRRERERLFKWAQAPSSVALHNISVASLHPTKGADIKAVRP